VGEVHENGPIPAKPSDLADSRAKQRAAYAQQQSLIAGLLALGAAGNTSSSGTTTEDGAIPVYDASQCVGPIIMGECHGSTIGPPRKTCHGTMINGQCTGPMF